MKATTIAPASIAIIKYWGRKNEALRLPENGSIGVNMSGLTSTTTVEFSPALKADAVTIDGVCDPGEAKRVVQHLNRIRALAGIGDRATVVSVSSFPASTGLSSSSSGFAALTVGAAAAAGLTLSERELSILARQASGSACRSIPAGFVEWLDGDTSETSYAVSLYPPEHWPIVDVVAIVSSQKKDVSSSAGHTTAASSRLFPCRKAGIPAKMTELKRILAAKDFTAFGELMEAEALEFHAITMTSTPSLLYLLPASLQLLRLCRQWRAEGLPVYFNVNTGQDVHLFVEQANVDSLLAKLREVPEVKRTIMNVPAAGARVLDAHLF